MASLTSSPEATPCPSPPASPPAEPSATSPRTRSVSQKVSHLVSSLNHFLQNNVPNSAVRKQAELRRYFPDVEDETLVDDFSCALLLRGFLLHGRLYITDGHLCFHSNTMGMKTVEVIPMRLVASVSRESAAVVFPSTIQITTVEGQVFLFSSFLYGKRAYNLIRQLCKPYSCGVARSTSTIDISSMSEDQDQPLQSPQPQPQPQQQRRYRLRRGVGSMGIEEVVTRIAAVLPRSFRHISKSKHEVFQEEFRLPKEERLLDEFACSLRAGSIVQGRLYVSQNFVCFSSSSFFSKPVSMVLGFPEIRSVVASREEGTPPVSVLSLGTSSGIRDVLFTTEIVRDKAARLLEQLSRISAATIELREQLSPKTEDSHCSPPSPREKDLASTPRSNDEDVDGGAGDGSDDDARARSKREEEGEATLLESYSQILEEDSRRQLELEEVRTKAQRTTECLQRRLEAATSAQARLERRCTEQEREISDLRCALLEERAHRADVHKSVSDLSTHVQSSLLSSRVRTTGTPSLATLLVNELREYVRSMDGKPHLLNSGDVTFIKDRLRTLCARIPSPHSRTAAVSTSLELPEDLWLAIFTFLPAEDVGRIAQVCRRWRELANDAYLWHRLCITRWRCDRPVNGSWKLAYREKLQLHHNWWEGRHRVRALRGHQEAINALAIFSNRLVTASEDETIITWDLETLRRLHVFHHSGPVFCLSFDGNIIVSASWDETIKIFNESTGNCLHTLHGHIDSVECIRHSAALNRIVSGSWDRTARVWDLSTGACLHTCRHEGVVFAIDFDETILMTGSGESDIVVWSMRTGERLAVMQGHTDAVTCLQRHGNWLYSASRDCSVRKWNVETGRCECVFEGHAGDVSCMQVTDRFLVSGSLDATCRVFDVATGSCIQVLQGHTLGVSCLQWDGEDRLVSGSHDTTLRLWDIQTGQCLQVLKGHAGPITCISLEEDRIVSASEDASVCLWSFGGIA